MDILHTPDDLISFLAVRYLARLVPAPGLPRFFCWVIFMCVASSSVYVICALMSFVTVHRAICCYCICCCAVCVLLFVFCSFLFVCFCLIVALLLFVLFLFVQVVVVVVFVRCGL